MIQQRALFCPFVEPLFEFCDRLVQPRLPDDWRARLDAFLAEQEPAGYKILPEHLPPMLEWIPKLERYYRRQHAARVGETAANEAEHTGPTIIFDLPPDWPTPAELAAARARAALARHERLARYEAWNRQVVDEQYDRARTAEPLQESPTIESSRAPEADKASRAAAEQVKAFRAFARRVAAIEQTRLRLTEDERIQYESYVLESQRLIARGEEPLHPPEFYLDKKHRFDQQQAESRRRYASVGRSNLTETEWQMLELYDKLRDPDRMSYGEYQVLLLKARLAAKREYYSDSDWNSFTRILDQLFNPAWHGTGTVDDILIALGPFGGAVPPGLGPNAPQRRRPLASPPRRGRRLRGVRAAAPRSGSKQSARGRAPVAPVTDKTSKAAAPSSISATTVATRWNYRPMFLAVRPDMPSGWIVHHRIPQRYRELVARIGLNVDEVQNLRGVAPGIHLQTNAAWIKFHQNLEGRPSAEEVIRFAEAVDGQFGAYFLLPQF